MRPNPNVDPDSVLLLNARVQGRITKPQRPIPIGPKTDALNQERQKTLIRVPAQGIAITAMKLLEQQLLEVLPLIFGIWSQRCR